MSSGGGAKSNDEIVFELADSILGKVMEKLDLENAKADMFEVLGSNKFQYHIPNSFVWTLYTTDIALRSNSLQIVKE